MLSAAIKQQLYTKLKLYERKIPYMYLDSEGNVTIGIGHLLRNVAEAQNLPFVIDKTNKKATAAEIKDDFDNVKNIGSGYKATFYKRFTKLKLSDHDITLLSNQDINDSYADLKRIYPDFDKFPDDVKLALFDLIFNLGAKDLRTKWPLFNKEIKAHNWKAAAKESHRKKPIPDERNKYVKDLLEKAPPYQKTRTSKPGILRP